MNRRYFINLCLAVTVAVTSLATGPAFAAAPVTGPGDTPDYYETSNWANSPPLRKFVDTLPGLNAGAKNNLNQYIPVAIPDTTTYPGSDYYELELGQYTEKMHSDLPPTTLRGYRQTNTADAGVKRTPSTGDLWWPHVYMPAENPFNPDMRGMNMFGRWFYGPWFYPATPICGVDGAALPLCITHGTVPNPYYDENCDPAVAGFCQPPEIPGTPNVSWGAEAFLDTGGLWPQCPHRHADQGFRKRRIRASGRLQPGHPHPSAGRLQDHQQRARRLLARAGTGHRCPELLQLRLQHPFPG